jgi:hypothetical protein
MRRLRNDDFVEGRCSACTTLTSASGCHRRDRHRPGRHPTNGHRRRPSVHRRHRPNGRSRRASSVHHTSPYNSSARRHTTNRGHRSTRRTPHTPPRSNSHTDRRVPVPLHKLRHRVGKPRNRSMRLQAHLPRNTRRVASKEALCEVPRDGVAVRPERSWSFCTRPDTTTLRTRTGSILRCQANVHMLVADRYWTPKRDRHHANRVTGFFRVGSLGASLVAATHAVCEVDARIRVWTSLAPTTAICRNVRHDASCIVKCRVFAPAWCHSVNA